MLPDDLFEKLAAPFPPDAISWRVGSTNIDKQTNAPRNGQEARGMALAYLDSRDVQDRLDAVCGPPGWQDDYPHAGAKTVCRIGLKVGDEWVWKSDGAGDTDVEAEKGALSDAFKRAAVKWGIGRYLYHLPSPWVALEQKGRSWVMKEDERPKLEKLLAVHSDLLEWGSPESRATLRLLLRTVRSFNTADDVRRFRSENEGTIAQLRVKARERLNEELDRIADASSAVAA